MSLAHRILGFAIVGAFLLLALWGLVLRLAGREQAPRAFWAIQHYTENILVLQVLVGLVLLAMGRRVVGGSLVWLHYLYGSVFPLIAVVAGRIAGLRRDRREYVALAWGALVAFGLTARALMTGLGVGV